MAPLSVWAAVAAAAPSVSPLASAPVRRPRRPRVACGAEKLALAAAAAAVPVVAEPLAHKRLRKANTKMVRSRKRRGPKGFAVENRLVADSVEVKEVPTFMSKLKEYSAAMPELSGPPDTERIVEMSLQQLSVRIIDSLETRGWWASEASVLPADLLAALRREAEELYRMGHLKKGSSASVDYFDRQNVYTSPVNGDQYDRAPHMCHYTMAVAGHLHDLMVEAFPEAEVSRDVLGNKLAVSAGDASRYAPHLDSGVGELPENRRLTMTLYLNPNWRPELGGELVLLGEGATQEAVALDSGRTAAGFPARIEPSAGRIVLFWSDRILHEVKPSWSPQGKSDFRIAHTVFLCATGAAKVSTDEGLVFEEPPEPITF